MQLLRLKRSWPGPWRRSVRDTAGRVLETLVFQPGEPREVDAQQYAALAKDVQNGTLELCDGDEKGRAYPVAPIAAHAHVIAQSILDGLLARGLKTLADAIQDDPERALEILLDGELPVPEGVVKSLREVMRKLTIDRSTLDAWRDRGMPGKPGAYDLGEIYAWAESHGLLGDEPGDENDDPPT